MARLQYRRVETRTVRGIEQAERLQRYGWRVIQSGLFFVLMEKRSTPA